VQLAGAAPGQKLLDYGCGDGTFLGLVSGRFGGCWGAEIALEQLEDCWSRLRPIHNLRFADIALDQLERLSTCQRPMNC
jgi:hypothetical protein